MEEDRSEAAEGESANSLPDLSGREFGGRYRLEELIGEGGMARVYRAVHLATGGLFALKVLDPLLAAKGGNATKKRFLAEARAVSQIEKHPHVVRVTDMGETEDGYVYFVMELLHGEDLRAVLAREGRLPWARVQAICVRVCSALKAAHKAGIVHRDVKPANVFVEPTETDPDNVKVLDFGIAKLLEAGEASKHHTQGVIGSAHFMSPEQAQAGDVDARSDVYSVGALMFLLLTGEFVFDDKSYVAILLKHVNHEPKRVTDVIDEAQIPAAVEEIVARALEKEPEHRFQSMGELLSAIKEQRVERREAPRSPPAEAAAAGSEPVSPRRRRGGLWLGGLGALAAAGAAVAWFGLGGSAPEFDAFSDQPAYALVQGEECTLRLTGQGMRERGAGEWFEPWCARLQEEFGLAGACDRRDINTRGGYMDVTVSVPSSFSHARLPLPDSDELKPVLVQRRLRSALFSNTDADEYTGLLKHIGEHLPARDPRGTSGLDEFEPRLDESDQAHFDEYLRTWDAHPPHLVRVTPYVHARLRGFLRERGQDLTPIVCTTRNQGAKTYRSIAFIRRQPDSFPQTSAPDGARVFEGIAGLAKAQDRITSLLEKKGQALRWKWGKESSASGYVTPCLNWKEWLSDNHPTTGHERGAEVDGIIKYVMAPDAPADELRVGVVYDGALARWRKENPDAPWDGVEVIWRSNSLPHGGLFMVYDQMDHRTKSFKKAVDDLAVEFSKRKEFDQCAMDFYASFDDELWKHRAAVEMCELPYPAAGAERPPVSEH